MIEHPAAAGGLNQAIATGLFASRMAAIAEEMGASLGCAALSPNIRDRNDYSCALFDASGQLLGQATHIPVHLGSMAYAMAGITSRHDWQDGDMLLLNDPYQGGTHLPDVTLIAPLLHDGRLIAFVANRAHHADIGADSPGSMPLSRHIDEEGLLIEPVLLLRTGEVREELRDRLLSALRNPAGSIADLNAQIAANRRGLHGLARLLESMGRESFEQACEGLQDYAARLASETWRDLPEGCYEYTDCLDDDGQGQLDLVISVAVTVADDAQGRRQIRVDFDGTCDQVRGNLNCPLPVTAAAVMYAFRCLLPDIIPTCAGAFSAIDIHARPGSLVHACHPAAVAAGNVETSMRITDVVLGALSRMLPDAIPAAGQGSMNNLAMGSAADDSGQGGWDYYETLGGGAGAGAGFAGLSGRQVHMTNTLNTPVEVLERAYPLRLVHYGLRQGSGGVGRRCGGDGLVREYRFSEACQVSLLSERRRHAPWGLAGGSPGLAGANSLDGQALPGKCSIQVRAGQRLRIETPGGGGWGSPGE